MTLIGRRAERDMLDEFVDAIRAGKSRALVLSGEAGVGKTALLNMSSRAQRIAAYCVPPECNPRWN